MVGKYRKKSKYHTNGSGNTGNKENITLMVGKYRKESKHHTNGSAIEERLPLSVVLIFGPVYPCH
jgi:hypothetical protein